MKSKSPSLSTLLAEKEKLQDEEIEMILKLNGGVGKPDDDTKRGV